MECHPVLDETHWSQLNAEGVRVSTYNKSKTITEKEAWKYLAELPEGNHKPELVTILPGLVLGEYICGGVTSSPALIRSIIMNTLPGVPHMAFSVVDIKDVVEAHFKGLFEAEAAGHRFIVVKENLWLVDICRIVHASVPTEYKDDI